MGKKMWFDDEGMKKGEWTPEEDRKLVAYINDHGICDWGSLPKRAGLQRLGKSCRLRWLNYLRPGIKKGKFTPQEEEDIIKLHAVLGNRWAAVAKHMENRIDNDIKNHWNSCLKKRLSRNGIDPMTHEPIINDLTVLKATNEECGSSSTTTSWPSMASPSSSTTTSWPSMASPSSSLTYGSARLLNKLAAGISSRQHDIDKIKNIISDPRITNNDQDKKDEEEGLKRDKKIGGGEEDGFLTWNDEDVRRYMEIDEMEYETTLYDSVLYESTHILDHLF